MTTVTQEEETETRSLLSTALPEEDRKRARTLPLPKLTRAALDNLCSQVRNDDDRSSQHEGRTGQVPEVILDEDEHMVRMDDLLSTTFDVRAHHAMKSLMAGRVKLDGKELKLTKDPHVPKTRLQGRILQMDKRLARVRPTCTCNSGAAAPGHHDFTCPVRTTK